MQNVAVIIPLFNGERWIHRTLQSTREQTHPPREIVVVDDGSTDRSIERASTFPGVTVLRNPAKGASSARNHGLIHSESPLVAFLDQDDVWHSSHLERLASILEANADAAAVSASCVSFRQDDDLQFPPLAPVKVRRLDLWENFPFGTVQCPGMVLVRRSALSAVGAWNTLAVGVGDLELWRAVSDKGDFLQSDAITVGQRIHPQSYSGVLRTRQIEDYLRRLRDRAVVQVRQRLAARPDQADFLHRRVQLAENLYQVGRHWVEGHS
jgi:glycosyltransferase involved in cell wall biosynthesis